MPVDPVNSLPIEHSRQRWSTASLWDALLVREMAYPPNVEQVTLPATRDFRMTLIVAGPADLESRCGAGWHQARDFVGKVGIGEPDATCTLRWRSESPGPLRRVHAYLPAATMERTASELWGAKKAHLRPASTLATVDPVIERVLLALRDAMRVCAPEIYAESAAQLLAVHMLTRHRADAPSVPVRGEDARLRKVEKYMQERFSQRITLADLAAVAGLSPFHFSRLFKASRGSSPMRFLNGVRVAVACRLLARPELTVAYISTACGFSTPSHFTAVFAQQVGVPPSTYRKAVLRRHH
jgi:AraC family transcriptional regulator